MQRIVAGEQYMTVYKPYAPEADGRRRDGRRPAPRARSIDSIANQTVDSPTDKGIPSVLVPVVR